MGRGTRIRERSPRFYIKMDSVCGESHIWQQMWLLFCGNMTELLDEEGEVR